MLMGGGSRSSSSGIVSAEGGGGVVIGRGPGGDDSRNTPEGLVSTLVFRGRVVPENMGCPGGVGERGWKLSSLDEASSFST